MSVARWIGFFVVIGAAVMLIPDYIESIERKKAERESQQTKQVTNRVKRESARLESAMTQIDINATLALNPTADKATTIALLEEKLAAARSPAEITQLEAALAEVRARSE